MYTHNNLAYGRDFVHWCYVNNFLLILLVHSLIMDKLE